MKRNVTSLKAGLLVLLCGSLYAFQLFRAAPVTLTLEEALTQKKVTCKLVSNGSYSGQSVVITLANATAAPLRITIPTGTVFKPNNEGDQDLIVTEQQVIALNGKATVKQVADGFCMEAHDSAPSPENGMKLSKTTNKNLQALTGFLDKKGYDPETVQQAVWIVSDGHSISNIDNDTPKGKELRTFLSKLVNQPDPWYATPQEVVMTPQRIIESNPVSVNGMLRFESDGKVKVHEIVKRVSDGKIMNTSDPMEFPQKGTWNYEFTLTVKGWEKGDYSVSVMNGTKALQVFPFTI